MPSARALLRFRVRNLRFRVRNYEAVQEILLSVMLNAVKHFSRFL